MAMGTKFSLFLCILHKGFRGGPRQDRDSRVAGLPGGGLKTCWVTSTCSVSSGASAGSVVDDAQTSSAIWRRLTWARALSLPTVPVTKHRRDVEVNSVTIGYLPWGQPERDMSRPCLRDSRHELTYAEVARGLMPSRPSCRSAARLLLAGRQGVTVADHVAVALIGLDAVSLADSVQDASSRPYGQTLQHMKCTRSRQAARRAPAGHAVAEPELSRQVLPLDPGVRHEQDPAQSLPVRHRGRPDTSFGPGSGNNGSTSDHSSSTRSRAATGASPRPHQRADRPAVTRSTTFVRTSELGPLTGPNTTGRGTL